MKNNTELWIFPYKDVAKGLPAVWELAIVETLNSLIEFELPMREFPFQRDSNTVKKERLIDHMSDGNYLLVLEHKKTRDIIGTVMIRPVETADYRVALFGYVTITKRYRNKGYGRDMMEQAEEIARNMECQAVHLAVLANNKGAQEFYTALKYQPTQINMGKLL
jgi:ribosomal protein S18 acetylase RimI-like enzyme